SYLCADQVGSECASFTDGSALIKHQTASRDGEHTYMRTYVPGGRRTLVVRETGERAPRCLCRSDCCHIFDDVSSIPGAIKNLSNLKRLSIDFVFVVKLPEILSQTDAGTSSISGYSWRNSQRFTVTELSVRRPGFDLVARHQSSSNSGSTSIIHIQYYCYRYKCDHRLDTFLDMQLAECFKRKPCMTNKGLQESWQRMVQEGRGMLVGLLKIVFYVLRLPITNAQCPNRAATFL
ncbi:hypothetical protein CBL_11651, partial [Carabus blaptoides fortunei]